jgi:hypothetical protein
VLLEQVSFTWNWNEFCCPGFSIIIGMLLSSRYRKILFVYYLHMFLSLGLIVYLIFNRLFLTVILTFHFFLVSWGGVRQSPLGTSATNWPIVTAPDDR